MELGWFDHIKILQDHQRMLADRRRLEAYREAIHQVVEPADIVVDLGAARVTEVDLPERADVLISEILWSFGIGEGIMGTILDARERFLKPGGRMLPLGFEMLVAPAELPEFYGRIAEPQDDLGLDFSALRTYALSNMYPTPIPADSLLSAPVALQRFDLLGEPPMEASGSATAEVARDGTVHGVVGWFSAELTPSIRITNPPSPKPSHWAQVFFPLSAPVEVAAGDQVGITVQTSANGSVWRWIADIFRAEGGRTHHTDATTFFGFPFDFEQAAEEARAG